jgi:hypothetical protein
VWPAAQLAGGFLLAWLFFYVAGRLLLAVPDEFHADNLWEAGVRQAMEFEIDE